MKKYTDEELAKHDNVATSEVEIDLEATKGEIEGYELELKGLMTNPPENKVRIYFIEGKTNRAKEFINMLEQLLEYRKK